MTDPAPSPRTVPTPREIVEHLDRFVCGQKLAKRDLAVAAYDHYLALAHRIEGHPRFEDFGKQHILLFGPTGTGKTYLVRQLAKHLGVPVAFASATSLVETGYAGDHVESVVRNLFAAANQDVFLAERGIVFLDEIDKVRRSHGRERDVSGEGVQNGLLTLLDGRQVTVRQGEETHRIDTSRIWFVCAGAFSDLAAIVRERRGRGEARIGFGPHGPDTSHGTDFADLLEAGLEDLQEFGFIPEFIGRFSTFSPLHPLGVSDLTGILVKSEGSILEKQRQLFRLHGIELAVDTAALEAIAELAVQLGTGARGLTRVLFRCLDDVDWRLPDLADEGVTTVVLTEDCIRKGTPPRVEHGVGEAKTSPPSEALRERALHPEIPRNLPDLPRLETDAAPEPLTGEEVRLRIESIKRDALDLDHASLTALEWLESFEREHRQDLRPVLRLLEELAARGSNLTEFFLAFIYAKTTDIRAVLHYLDYSRRRREVEETRCPPGRVKPTPASPIPAADFP